MTVSVMNNISTSDELVIGVEYVTNQAHVSWRGARVYGYC